MSLKKLDVTATIDNLIDSGLKEESREESRDKNLKQPARILNHVQG
jgi:hypothetical protein